MNVVFPGAVSGSTDAEEAQFLKFSLPIGKLPRTFKEEGGHSFVVTADKRVVLPGKRDSVHLIRDSTAV
jgi:hypothetical protein